MSQFNDPVKLEDQQQQHPPHPPLPLPHHFSILSNQLQLLPMSFNYMANPSVPLSSIDMMANFTFPAASINKPADRSMSLTAELSRAAFKTCNYPSSASYPHAAHQTHSPSPMMESPAMFPTFIQQSPIQANQPLPPYSPMSFYFDQPQAVEQLPVHMIATTNPISIPMIPSRSGSNELCSLFEEAFPNSLSNSSPAAAAAAPSPPLLKSNTHHSPLPPLLKRRQSAPYQLNNSATPPPATTTTTTTTAAATGTTTSTNPYPILPIPKQRTPRLKSISTPDFQSPTTGATTPILDTRPRDFQCTICQNRFLRRQDLSRHEVTHTRSKEYVCPFGCGSCFGRSDALSRHMKGRRCSRGGE
ncbi:hypothetical protein CcCBS67573_g04298 [Chytriomyces confervae]|uniref:C2H2-type domain-containing protein n=1 Tax=Chytriomyces confervae TaxID=246404 RepID=A0A507FDV7_9FUNG|nr:hypothetical protein CcCBS67573_g04298 [Chytriomyces confervae]